MIRTDPEQHLRTSPAPRRVSYPGYSNTSGIYGLFVQWYQTRATYTTDLSHIDAYIKARYTDACDHIIPVIARSMIHTILTGVEYPDIQRPTAVTRQYAQYAQRYQVQLQFLTLEERCAAMIDAVYQIMLDVMQEGTPFAWVTRLRQRLPYTYIRACERDAGQQYFKATYQLCDTTEDLTILPTCGSDYRA